MKVILFFIGLAFLSGGLIIGLTWRTVQASDMKSLKEVGLDKASELAELITLKDMQSETRLLPLLQAEQKASVDSDYVAVLDNTGRVVAHTNVGEKGVLYTDLLTQRILRDNSPGTQVVNRAHEIYLEVWFPLWAKSSDATDEQFLLNGAAVSMQTQRLGTVRLDIPLHESLAMQSRIIRQMILIVMIIGAIAFLLTLGLMHKLLIPIRLLTQGTGRVAQGEYGTEVPVTSHDELGDLTKGFNVMSRTLSETTVSKKILAESEERFRQMAENITEVFWMSDVDLGGVIYISPSFEKVWGIPCEELYRHPMLYTESIHPDDRALIVAALKKPAVGFDHEYRIIRPDGTIRWIRDRGSPIHNAAGDVYRVVGIAEDITSRRQFEGAMRQSEKLSAVGQLAAGVAHEINNPLGVILGFAQAVVRRLQPNDPLEMPLKSIEKEAVRCKNLVQDLLTFSRVSKIDREPMDITRAVEGAFSLIMAQARLTHVDVRKELAPGLPRILGNLNQIQQVIINLANNALDGMGEKSGILTVKTEILIENHLSWVCLKVTDNGPGIPEAIMSKIFDPFFTTKPVGKGTGLGLSLVHEIIKKHSGSIDVKSRPGCTEFTIKFPVHQTTRVTASL